MSKKQSAGILLFRESDGNVEVLLVHPGGPFWAKKDDGAWSIPKGELEDGESPFEAAKREFQEETGMSAPVGDFIPLEPVRQPGGKMVHAWAVKGNFDLTTLKSNTFSIEWPPRSGRQQEFPEVDRAGWLSFPVAKHKILKGQAPILAQLLQKLGAPPESRERDDSADSTGRGGREGSLFDKGQ